MTELNKPSLFDDWAAATTAHGFYDFSKAKTKRGKGLWMLIIILCFALMGYQLYRTIAEFGKHEWKTTVQEVPGNPGKKARYRRRKVYEVNAIK